MTEATSQVSLGPTHHSRLPFTEIAHLTGVCKGDVLPSILSYETKVHRERLQLCFGDLCYLMRIYVSPGCFHLRIHSLPDQLPRLAPATQGSAPPHLCTAHMCPRERGQEVIPQQEPHCGRLHLARLLLAPQCLSFMTECVPVTGTTGLVCISACLHGDIGSVTGLDLARCMDVHNLQTALYGTSFSHLWPGQLPSWDACNWRRDPTWMLNKACTARWSLKVMLSTEVYASWRAGSSAVLLLLLLCCGCTASRLRHSTRSVQAGVRSFSFSGLFGEELCTIAHLCLGNMLKQGDGCVFSTLLVKLMLQGCQGHILWMGAQASQARVIFPCAPVPRWRLWRPLRGAMQLKQYP